MQTDGTYTNVYHRSTAVIDCSRDGRSRTFSNYDGYAGAVLRDPLNTITFSAGLDLHCRIGEIDLDQLPGKKYTIGAHT